MKQWSDGNIFVTSKLTSEICLVIVKEQYLGGLHCYTCLLFRRMAKFKMAAIVVVVVLFILLICA